MTVEEDNKNKAGAPPAGGANQPPEGTKTVPLPELLKEREKRQSLEAERDSLRQTLAVMQQQVQSRPMGNVYEAAPQQYQQQQVAQEMQQLWAENPQKAVQREIMMAMNWSENTHAAVEMQESQVATKFADFNNFRDPIRTYLRTLPLQQRAQPGVVEAAYYFVKGQQVDNIVRQSQEEVIRRMRAGESIQGFDGAGAAPPAAQTKQLTDEQKRVANAMGMSFENYQKNLR